MGMGLPVLLVLLADIVISLGMVTVTTAHRDPLPTKLVKVHALAVDGALPMPHTFANAPLAEQWTM